VIDTADIVREAIFRQSSGQTSNATIPEHNPTQHQTQKAHDDGDPASTGCDVSLSLKPTVTSFLQKYTQKSQRDRDG